MVRVAAIESLATLGEARSLSILEPLANEDSNDSLAQAATETLTKLQESAPLVPKELKKLRQLIRELSHASKQLRQEVDQLQGEAEAAK